MAITFTKNETFDGTRVQSSPDPDNEGETISETITGIRDIEVTILLLLTLELLKLALVLNTKSQLA